MSLRTIEHGAISRGNRIGARRGVLLPASIDVPDVGVVGLVGINGAGKSTLMLELSGTLRKSRASRRRQTPVAFAPQRPAFPDWLDARGVVRLFGYEYDALEAAYPALLLEELRRTRGNELSVGQMQALSIALALHAEADLTLLDEPFAPLDFRRRVALSHILRERRRTRHGLVIVSSQSAAELLDVCDWMVVLHSGRYAFTGPIASIVEGRSGDDARAALETFVLSMI